MKINFSYWCTHCNFIHWDLLAVLYSLISLNWSMYDWFVRANVSIMVLHHPNIFAHLYNLLVSWLSKIRFMVCLISEVSLSKLSKHVWMLIRFEFYDAYRWFVNILRFSWLKKTTKVNNTYEYSFIWKSYDESISYYSTLKSDRCCITVSLRGNIVSIGCFYELDTWNPINMS